MASRSWKKSSTSGRLRELGSGRNRDAERAALAMASSGDAIAAGLLDECRCVRAVYGSCCGFVKLHFGGCSVVFMACTRISFGVVGPIGCDFRRSGMLMMEGVYG